MLGCAALAVAAVQALTGEPLVLYAAPFLLLAGLLLSGRFIGEDAILARRAAATARVPRPVRRRWSPVREQALAALLERSTRQLRGPPRGDDSPNWLASLEGLA